MNKIILAATFIFSIVANSSNAEIGVGAILGEPTGLSLRVDQSQTRAFDAALAWRLGDGGYVSIHVDYLFIKPKGLRLDQLNFDWYFGFGAALGLADGGSALALRVPVGVSYKFADPSLELFAELAPGLLLAPATGFEVFGGIGLRYWF